MLDENFGSEESIVLLGELYSYEGRVSQRDFRKKVETRIYLLDELLVLVKLLQVINRHVLELDKLGTIDIGSISENADRHARSGDVGEPNQIIFRLISAP